MRPLGQIENSIYRKEILAHPFVSFKIYLSNMTFTPADFWIGESGIWFFLWRSARPDLSKVYAAIIDGRGQSP